MLRNSSGAGMAGSPILLKALLIRETKIKRDKSSIEKRRLRPGR